MLFTRLASSFRAVSQLPRISSRSLNSSQAPLDLRAFLDLSVKDGKPAPTGREWQASDLRRKNWDDLHKLWHVLLKERLMLKSEQLRYRSKGESMPFPMRITKVRKSMNRIKQVEIREDSAKRMCRNELGFLAPQRRK